jgi:hypothetical protein
MKIAISQPTYLPWIGYFDLIDQVDLFVFLDNVQFEKQSWQQRNRIKTAVGLQWLTTPVIFRGRFGQLIKDVAIRDSQFCRSHIRSVELAYRRSPYFGQHFSEFSDRLRALCEGSLVELNIGLIDWIMGVLGIRTPTVRASALLATGKRTELLASICGAVGATKYISPVGSAVYLLGEQDHLNRANVEILFQNYRHPEYRQVYTPFEPYASVVDLLFNCGTEALKILRTGRGAPYSVKQLSAIPIGSDAAKPVVA